ARSQVSLNESRAARKAARKRMFLIEANARVGQRTPIPQEDVDMALATPSGLALGDAAPDFALPATDGKTWRLADVKGDKGTLIAFICNHCPYVKAVLDDIIADARELAGHGVGTIAIMPNDTHSYPDDSFANMAKLAAAKRFPFPYAIDETQGVAR